MRQMFLLLILWSFTYPVMSQTVQWANEVISFSSQYEDDYYAAHQALGVPNALMNERLNYMAWVPKKEESMVGEYLQVGFKTAMKIQQVAVAESLNPGAIYRISAFDRDGKKHVIYEQKGVKGTMKPARIFRHKFPLTEYYVKSIKLELNTKAVPGSNQIDAIAISDSADDIKPRVSVLRYEEEVAQPEELGVAVNSIYSERLPIITPDGQTLFFTRKEHPKNIGADNKDDIWVSYRKDDDTWSSAVNIGIPLNNDDHNFVVATDPSSKQLYLGNDYDKSTEGISISKKEGRSWSKPKGMKIEDHYNDSPFVGYHVNINGDVLLMSVQRKEGFGERDFYVSFKRKNNEWTKPKNLGTTINTVNTENSIFLAADNQTIYFSSNGHPGYGGFDMFMSRRLDNSWTKWSKPKNLGKNINSKENDFNYTIPASGEYAYFASGSMDDSDLYRIKLPKEVQPKPVALVKARLVDAETGELVDGQLSVQKIGNKNKKTKPNTSDEHQIVLPFGSDVGIYAERDGYFSVSESVALSDSKFKELDGNGSPPSETSSVDNSEIDRLQLQLKVLKKELARLEKKRDQARSKPSTVANKVNAEDAELERLRNKFNDLSEDEPSDKKDKIAKEEDSSGDDELDALRKRFNQHYKKEHADSSVKDDVDEDTEEDPELAEMKRRFNQHYNKKETPKKEDKPDQVAEIEQEEKLETEEGASVDFEAYQEDMRQELTIELTPQIKKELHRELFVEAKRDLNTDIRSKLTPEIEAAVKKQLRKNLEKADIVNYEPQVSEAERVKISPLIEEELRDNLGNKIEKELRLSMKEPIKTEIQQEMEYAIKRSAEKEVRAELQQQLKEQAKAEKEQTIAATPQEEEAEEDIPTKPAYKEVEKEILLVPIKIGQIIPMNNIFFAANESKLKKESFGELDRVLAFLEENPNLIVEVGGHTNGWCSHEFAHELSTDRSKVVMNYFLSKGIESKRIQNRGYGKTNPVATNDTRTGRSKNQRVELKILEIK